MAHGARPMTDYRGLPRDLLQDIKRAAYEAKVREMEDLARLEQASSVSHGIPHTDAPVKDDTK